MQLRKTLSRLNGFYDTNFYYYKNKDKLRLSKGEYNKLKAAHKDHVHETVFNNRKIVFGSQYWFLHSLDEIFVTGVYQFTSENKQPIIIDCGANVGLSVIYFKELFSGSKIIAFEADPGVFKQLEKNLEHYHFENVDLINAAVWDEATTIVFNGDGSLGGRVSPGGVMQPGSIEVRTERLSNYLDGEIDFLKIDIEGAEYQVLKDCRHLLPNVKNLFIEYHHQDGRQTLHEILSWVVEAGFTYYIREAWNNRNYPFMKNEQTFYQMQLNIFCYRENNQPHQIKTK